MKKLEANQYYQITRQYTHNDLICVYPEISKSLEMLFASIMYNEEYYIPNTDRKASLTWDAIRKRIDYKYMDVVYAHSPDRDHNFSHYIFKINIVTVI